MNTADKRQYNLRSKLVAAVAMLLISCIMMVSATYAWFTLSTAPEVQGITTTVGANGNLEIALSPYSGNAEDVTSAMGDANLEWEKKNITWGNLINLSDPIYGLDKIALLPARLNAADTGSAGFQVNTTSPLSTPTYGADGRPQALNANTAIGSKIASVDASGTATPATDFVANAYKGIRAIGTSASMTEWEMTFNAALSDMAAAISNARTYARASLEDNGGSLTGMAIQHGLVDGEDNGNYKSYVAGLRDVMDDLQAANDALIDGIKAGLLAEAASSASTTEKYNAAVAAITDGATIDEIRASAYGQNHMTADENLLAAITKCAAIGSAISAADAKLTPLESDDTVTWAEISAVLTPLMDTSKIKINGIIFGEFMALGTTGIGNNVLKNGLNITMIAGSGLYADFGAVIGNIEASVMVPEFTYGDDELGGWEAFMETDSETVAGGHMPAARTTVAGYGVLDGGSTGATNVINVPYAYIVDFMFRTNASGSSLMLQTSGAQRVYEDSVSSATQGSGSTMTFAVTEALDAEATLNLMNSIRVVFMSTDNQTIYGIAKLDTAIYDAMGTDKLAALTEIEADLYLYNYSFDKGVLTFGSKIAEDSATLCGLAANTATKVSALVYLDGDQVTNADVANGVTSMTGAMNLQFASSAELVPMENTALKNMEGAGEYKATIKYGDQVIKSTTVTAGANYSYNASEMLAGWTDVNVVVTMGGTVVDGAWDASNKTININNVSGEIVVTVTGTAPAGT